jgi:hypothetical protein
MSAAGSAAQRGAKWLRARQRPDGSLEGTSSVGDYYKAPFALTVTGHLAEADRLLRYVAGRFLKKDGQLDGTGVDWFDAFRLYPHAWLTLAAFMRGRFEMAYPLLGVVLACHDDRTGGFFGTTEGSRNRRGPQEVMSTSMAGLACLWGGRVDVARATGGWLRNLHAAQPDLTRGLYVVWDSAAGLVTSFSEQDAVSFLVDARRPAQWYFEYGIAAAFLSSLSAATGEPTWLELAQQFLRATRHCREDVYRQPASGKIAWGGAWTYRLSRDPEDRRIAEAAADGLRALQDAEGWWSGLGVYEREKAGRLEPNVDVTNEFVGLLGSVDLVFQEVG